MSAEILALARCKSQPPWSTPRGAQGSLRDSPTQCALLDKLSDLALALGVPLSALMQDAELEARVMRIAESARKSLTERRAA